MRSLRRFALNSAEATHREAAGGFLKGKAGKRGTPGALACRLASFLLHFAGKNGIL